MIVDKINKLYSLNPPIHTNSFSIKQKEKEKKEDKTEEKEDKTETETETEGKSNYIMTTLKNGKNAFFAMFKGKEFNQPMKVRLQIMHWYMFFNYYFLKVAIEIPFIKYVNPHASIYLSYTNEVSQHPVIESRYLEESLTEYKQMFQKIKNLFTIDELKTSDLDENLIRTVFETSIFDDFAKEAGNGRIMGGFKHAIKPAKKPKSRQYKLIHRSVKYRRSTRHRKKHRNVTSKRRIQYTSKKRNVKRAYSKKIAYKYKS
jgi:hypothetical protein